MTVTLRESSIQHAEYADFKSRWKLIRDVLAGKKDIDDEGEAYLPKPNNYSDNRYLAYQIRAVLYNATARTLEGYLGAIFRKELDVELPTKLEYLSTDTDGAGNNITQFSKKVCKDVISMGRHGILVDYPSSENVETLEDERNANLQARLISYTPESIVNWHCLKKGTRTVLSNVLLEEIEIESSSHVFNQDFNKKWRLLELDENGFYVQRVMEQVEVIDPKTNERTVTVVEEKTIIPTLPDGSRLDYIPFIFIGSETFTPTPDNPPLYDLAQLNIAHYRNSADWEQAIFMVGQPTPWISGLDTGFIDENKGQLVIGSNAAWLLPDGATAGMLESKAERNIIQKAMEFKEVEMVGLGARIIQDNTSRGSESAESVQIRRSGEASQLACIADNVSQALVKCFEWAAAWMGAEGEIKYQLNKDFFAQRLGHQELRELIAAWHGGGIPQDVLLDNLRKGEIISELLDNDEVKDMLDEEGPPLGTMTTEPQGEEVDATDSSQSNDS